MFLILFIASQNLGSDSFKEREQAYSILESVGILALPYIDLNSDDPEILNKSRKIWRKILHNEMQCWIDSLPIDYKDRENIIIKYLALARETQVGYRDDFWPDYKYATTLYINDLIGKKVELIEIIKLLRIMKPLEIEQRIKYKYPFHD